MSEGYDSRAQARRSAGGIGILLFVAIILAGVGWWFARKHPVASASGLAQLAAAAPAETQLFLAFDLRTPWPAEKIASRFDALKKRLPEVARQVDELEKKSGVKIDEIARWARPAGSLAVMPVAGQKSMIASGTSTGVRPIDFVAILVIADEAAAQRYLEQGVTSAKQPAETSEQDGVKLWSIGSGDQEVAFGVGRGYLWIGSGASAIGRATKVLSGAAPSLATQPRFVAARKRADAHEGVLAYLALHDLVGPLNENPSLKRYVDDQTMQALQALEYVAASADLSEKSGEGTVFLGVDPASTAPLAKAMLTAHPITSPLARLFPARWANYSSINAVYAGAMLYQIAMLVPETRSKLGLGLGALSLQLGFDLVADFQKASNGDVAWSSDALQLMPQMLTRDFDRARGAGQLTACTSNLKNIGTAAEMFSTDHSGRFPTTLGELVPDYLKAIPTCPAAGADTYSPSWRATTSPDGYAFGCSGHHHAARGIADNCPAYTSNEGLVGDTPTASASGSQDTPSWLVAVSLTDEAAARQLVERLEQKAGRRGAVTGRIDSTEIHGYDGLPLRWAVVTQPTRALLLAFGPKADACLEEALKTAVRPADTVDGLSQIQTLSRDVQDRIEHVGYVDFTPMVRAFRTIIKTLPTTDPSQAWVFQMIDEIGELRSVTVMSAEPDGVMLRSSGVGVPVVAGGAVLSAVLVPSFVPARTQGKLTACKSNLKNIGTALEMYSTDHSGRFPTQLSELVPDYLRAIPTCPAAQSDTYAAGFQSASVPDAYTVVCGGHHHQSVGYSADHPLYTSTQGLIER